MPSTPHLIGYAELLGRLRHVLTVNGEDAVTRRADDSPFQPYFDRYGWPHRLHAHVLFGLDSHIDPTSLLNLEPAVVVYQALGYPLTAKATAFARETEQLTEQGWTWGHTLDTATIRAVQDDEPQDTHIGDAAVLAVLSHVAARHAAEMTTPNGTTALFHCGYPFPRRSARVALASRAAARRRRSRRRALQVELGLAQDRADAEAAGHRSDVLKGLRVAGLQENHEADDKVGGPAQEGSYCRHRRHEVALPLRGVLDRRHG
ncbi:hypothetical protein [Frankia sp. Cj3]|uniref:hypothetical protein n=1 Tax=Frankia sp. Cj3 TaxID=2880976 RepID=UPI001EF496B9|nr:hypothetical protein [Frankia sp. Cj3]